MREDVWSLGIDVASRAPHRATLACNGVPRWSGYSFISTLEDFQSLWDEVAEKVDPTKVTVVLEPTRNGWILIADWYRARGLEVVMLPSSRSASLRDYLSKNTKNDVIDSEVLAKVMIFHPEGLDSYVTLGPADGFRRVTKLRDTLVRDRTADYNRLDALLELLGPAWYGVLGSSLGVTAIAFLASYAHPHKVIELGETRLAAFLAQHSRGHWREEKARSLMVAAQQTLDLWRAPDGSYRMNFEDLCEDVAVFARRVQYLTGEIADAEKRCAEKYETADPDHIYASVPGVGDVNSAVLAARIGDVGRFDNLAAVRSYTGLVPGVNQSGYSNRPCSITKAGDPLLRSAAFTCADHARRYDPQLAAKYKRLREDGKHHNSAVCHIATTLITRAAACRRDNTPYVIRDVDGTPVSQKRGRQIVQAKYKYIPPKKQTKKGSTTTRNTTGRSAGRSVTKGAGREEQESLNAPQPRPATGKATPKRTKIGA